MGRLIIGTLAAVLALGPAGCQSTTETASKDSSARFLAASFPDSLDPQLSFTAEGWQAMWNSYIPLLTFKREPGEAGAEVMPGLATALPEISADGKTYRLTLRDGVRYSDGKLVKASDVEHALERMFDVNSPGSPFYTDIVGASQYQRGTATTIAGIKTDDASGRIVIRLEKPRGAFLCELALMFAAPVPADAPSKDQTETPLPATGPYVIADVEPGREFTLERNPEWDHNATLMSDLSGAGLEEITVAVERNLSTQTSLVARGEADFMLDPPPPDRLPEIESEYSDRFVLDSTASTYYFWMNTQRPPFDDLRVRRAVNYAIDPVAISKLYGGLLKPTQQVLPPGMPGYERFELYPHDIEKAKRLVAQANPADRSVTIWTDGVEPNDRAGQYYQDLLTDLGFEADLKTINASIYFDTIGNAKTPDLDTGWTNWFQSYPHPNDFFAPQLSGENIAPVHNNNNAMLDDPKITKQISELSSKPLSEEVQPQYARLDKSIMKLAPWAPFGNLLRPTFVSDRIDVDQLYFHPVFQQDYASFAFE